MHKLGELHPEIDTRVRKLEFSCALIQSADYFVSDNLLFFTFRTNFSCFFFLIKTASVIEQMFVLFFFNCANFPVMFLLFCFVLFPSTKKGIMREIICDQLA